MKDKRDCPVCDASPIASTIVELTMPSERTLDAVMCRSCGVVFAPERPGMPLDDEEREAEP